MRSALERITLILLATGQQELAVTHVYAIYYGEDNDVIDELALRMKKQARMSTRFHNERWDLHVSEFCVKVIFRYEADYDDFQISFEENHRSFLDSHYLIDR